MRARADAGGGLTRAAVYPAGPATASRVPGSGPGCAADQGAGPAGTWAHAWRSDPGASSLRRGASGHAGDGCFSSR